MGLRTQAARAARTKAAFMHADEPADLVRTSICVKAACFLIPKKHLGFVTSVAYGSRDYNHLTIRALTIQIYSEGWARQTVDVTNGLCTYLFLSQNVVHRESKSRDARINVYFKSYKEAAKAVSDVTQRHTAAMEVTLPMRAPEKTGKTIAPTFIVRSTDSYLPVTNLTFLYLGDGGNYMLY